jgi:hypothetical protein
MAISSPLNMMHINTILISIPFSVIYLRLFILLSLHVSAHIGHLQKACIKRSCFKIVIYKCFVYFKIISSYEMSGITDVVFFFFYLLRISASIIVYTAVTRGFQWCFCNYNMGLLVVYFDVSFVKWVNEVSRKYNIGYATHFITKRVFFNIRRNCYILWLVDPLLGNDRERWSYTTAVAK